MNRIDGINPLATSRTQSGSAAAGAGSVGTGHGPDGSGEGRHDALSVSERGRLVARAALAVQSAASVRQERVAALKAAIAAGTYHVDAEAIARRLIANGLHRS